MKRSIVTALSLLFVAAASFAEVSGERPISDPAYGPPPGQRYGTAAASDGHDFLVAWVDVQRNGANPSRIYAARMNASGEILDPLSIRLPTISGLSYQVDVVFLGDAYLVYWNEVSSNSSNRPMIVGVRISRDGILLDSTPRMFVDGARVNVHGAASNGNRTVIVFGDSLIVLDRSGNIVDGPKAVIPGNTGTIASMVASNGRDFLVIWEQKTTILAARLDANGVSSSSAMAITTSPFSDALLNLASDGESYVTIVREGFGVVAQHIGAAGELLEKSPVPLQEEFPGFAFTGGFYLLMDGDPVQGTIGIHRLDRTGQPAGSYVAIASGQSFGAGATLASNGADSGFFWTEWNTATQSFSGLVVNGQSLTSSKATPITRSAKYQAAPAAATSGSNHAVVWNEDDGLYTGRITLDGQLLDGRGIRVGNRAAAEPRIAYDGTNYIIGWVEQNATTPPVATVKIARLSPAGTLLDPSGILVSSGQCARGVSLAPASSSTLVSWSDCTQILAAIAGRDGTVGLPVKATPTDTKNTGSVSSAWNGHEWLVVWEDLIPSTTLFVDPGQAYDILIKAARLSPSLALLDPRPIAVSDTRQDSRPIVASNGNGFLIVWTRYQDTPPDLSGPYSVVAQRISSDGSLLAQTNGVRLTGGESKSVAWDGLQYDLALTSHVYVGNVPQYNLFVTHVMPEGLLESLAPLAVTGNTINSFASLIVTGTGRVTTVYTRVGSEAQYGDVERAFVSIPHAIRGRASR